MVLSSWFYLRRVIYNNVTHDHIYSVAGCSHSSVNLLHIVFTVDVNPTTPRWFPIPSNRNIQTALCVILYIFYPILLIYFLFFITFGISLRIKYEVSGYISLNLKNCSSGGFVAVKGNETDINVMGHSRYWNHKNSTHASVTISTDRVLSSDFLRSKLPTETDACQVSEVLLKATKCVCSPECEPFEFTPH